MTGWQLVALVLLFWIGASLAIATLLVVEEWFRDRRRKRHGGMIEIPPWVNGYRADELERRRELRRRTR